MCQLAAYTGDRPKAPLLLKAIELQEAYLGGHASGLGVISEGELKIEKDIGPVERVRGTTKIEKLDGTVGIAHSRWGHGHFDARYNTQKMAHPFTDCNNALCLMHNGTIVNFKQHWDHLKERHPFRSYEPEIDAITDSEIAVHMLEEQMDRGHDLGLALRKIAPKLIGAFLFACMNVEEPTTIWIANWYQPCVVGIGDDETMFCSSPSGFDDVQDAFDKIFEPPKNSLIKLKPEGVEITTLDPKRNVPNLKLDGLKLGELVMEVLKSKGPVDYRDLRYELKPDAWAEAYSIHPNEFDKLWETGVSIVNPLIQVLDGLASAGKIKKWINIRPEAGVERVPRYTYSLIN